MALALSPSIFPVRLFTWRACVVCELYLMLMGRVVGGLARDLRTDDQLLTRRVPRPSDIPRVASQEFNAELKKGREGEEDEPKAIEGGDKQEKKEE